MNNFSFKNNLAIHQDLLEFAPKLYLKTGKIHEACGPSKIRIAILLASITEGLIIWVRPNWTNNEINMEGISSWFSPSRLLLVKTGSDNDLLFSTEEILRSGVANLTIAELPKVPNTLQMRRLNLSMRRGILSNMCNTNIGLILTPNKGGAPNVESRWYASPLSCWDNNLPNKASNVLKQKWLIKRLFSKTEPIKEWYLESIQFSKNNMGSKPKLILMPSENLPK